VQNCKTKSVSESNKSAIRGFTQVDNFLLDDVFPLVATKFPKYPSVLLAIIRKTIGWQKDSDWISLTQLQRQSGASRKCVVAAVSCWCQVGLVRKEGRSGPRGTVRYSLIRDYDPVTLTSILRQLVKPPNWFLQGTTTSIPRKPSLVSSRNTQKKNYKINQKKESGKASPYPKHSPPPKGDFKKEESFKVDEAIYV
jgi:phage replication O-like protein O